MCCRPRSSALLTAFAVVLGATVATAGHEVPLASAQDPPATEPAPAPPVADPRISPLLVSVPVDSPAYRAAVVRYRDAEARLAAARAAFAENQSVLVDLQEAEARLTGARNEATRKRDKAERRAAELRSSVQDFAVASYIGGQLDDPVIPSLDLAEMGERARLKVLADTASEQQLTDLSANVDRRDAMQALLTGTEAELVDVQARAVDATAAREAASTAGSRATADLERFGREVADARLEAQVVGLDFTFVVLDAYVKGAFALAAERPSCGLRWTALAGIGRTESGHGTFGGAVVRADGSITRPIIGIPLDGTNGTAVIGDSDGGQLDGDPAVDRAVGPMQFIPTSWRSLGRDGNDDGRADPQNMYDAAAAAANLLCRSQPLTDDGRLRAAFLRYNNSNAYASQVLERTKRYDEFVIPPPPP